MKVDLIKRKVDFIICQSLLPIFTKLTVKITNLGLDFSPHFCHLQRCRRGVGILVNLYSEIERWSRDPGSRVQFPAGGLGVAFFATCPGWVLKLYLFDTRIYLTLNYLVYIYIILHPSSLSHNNHIFTCSIFCFPPLGLGSS